MYGCKAVDQFMMFDLSGVARREKILDFVHFCCSLLLSFLTVLNLS